MAPNSRDGGMFLAPGAASATATYSFPTAERRPTPPPAAPDERFPRVDDHLVLPEVSRDEIIQGRKIHSMGANPPHAEAHVRADFVIAPHVREGYVAAADLLTRVNEKSNFATDISIRKVGDDPSTGARYLEELSFEIVNEQSLRDIADKARDLTRRGVRRVFAIFVKTGEVGEWSPAKNEFLLFDKNGVFEDLLFIRPIAVRALLNATQAEAEVIKALDKKNHAEVLIIRQQANQKGFDEGLKKGRDEGLVHGAQKLLLNMLRTRFHHIPQADENRIYAANSEQLERWGTRLLTASSIDDVFAEETSSA
jgi:hypothetical protein